MNDRLLGVVLCGGRSSRMGRDKAGMLHPNGVTFLQHAIDRLSGLCDEVAISGQPPTQHGATIIADPIAHRGPVTGIAAALSYAADNDFSACLITPVDTPWLTPADLESLREHWLATRKTTMAHSNRLQPLIGIYPVELSGELQCLADSEDRSLFRWLQSRPEISTVELPPNSCHNINTPEDLPKHDR